MTDSPQQDSQQGNRRIGTVNKFYKEFGPFLTLGVQLAAAVIVFYFIGSWVDKSYDTSPAFTLVGIMLGTVGGLIKFFKTVIDLSKKENPPKANDDRES
ncbi:MAG: AtpZ/AtpI family protein [Ignavibacteriae bacterium]|nr:AtpZ/AtpI family protein [Ignavibacteriota bacterium]